MAIIYKTFNGEEYTNKKEYEKRMKQLLNTKIAKLDWWDIDNFVTETFNDEYADYNPCETISTRHNWSNKIAIRVVKVGTIVCLKIGKIFRDENKLNNKKILYSGVALEATYEIDPNTKLKGLHKVCSEVVREMLTKWKNITLVEVINKCEEALKGI